MFGGTYDGIGLCQCAHIPTTYELLDRLEEQREQASSQPLVMPSNARTDQCDEVTL